MKLEDKEIEGLADLISGDRGAVVLDPQNGNPYPRTEILNIYGYVLKRCCEDPWNEDFYALLKMVARLLDIPEGVQRMIHSEAMLEPNLLRPDPVDPIIMERMEELSFGRPLQRPTKEKREYGMFSNSPGIYDEAAVKDYGVMMEMEQGSLLSKMEVSVMDPEVDSGFSLDTMDKKRPHTKDAYQRPRNPSGTEQ